MRRHGKEVVLGGGLRDAVRRLGGTDRVQEADLARIWVHVVGDDIARHTHILGSRKGELLVGVDSPVWATELSALSERFRTALNSEIGQETVKEMRFTVSKSVGMEREREKDEGMASQGWTQKVDPIPLSEEERAGIKRAFEGVSDDSLREAAVRAAVRGLEWKRGEEAPNGPHEAPGGSTEHE
ncbi:MAG: DUF721 domain-containing protein [Actinomycetota bacterium]|nr:DUF721 domain-containing protein [Actinomycetota bacterium]